MSGLYINPFSGRLLWAVAYLMLCGPWATAAADDVHELGSAQIPPIPAGNDDPEIRQLFETEYPAACEKLRSAVARIRGSILIDDLYQKGQAGSGSQRQTFSRFDDHVIFRATESKQDAGFAGQGGLVTPGEAAQVLNANTESAAVSFTADTPNWRMKILYDDRIRNFVDATFSCAGDEGIQPELQRGTFQYLAGYRHPAQPELVVVSFGYSRDGILPERPEKGTATVVLNTAKDWVIEQFESFWTAPSEIVIRGIVESSVIEDLGRVPSKVILEHFYELKPGSSPGRIGDSPLFRRTKAVVSELRPVENFSAEEFSLAALGVTGSRPRLWRNLLIAGNLVLLLMAIGYPIMRRRSRSAR